MKLEIDKFFLRNDRLLETIPQHVKTLLEAGMVKGKVKKGRLLFREDSFSKGVYILRKGKIKIYRTSRDGREQILYIHTEGEMVGYRPLLYEGKHSVSATALEECTYNLIPRDHFMHVLNTSPELVRALLACVSHEFSVWVNNITVFAQQPVKSRVALGLLIFNRKFQIKGKHTEINLSRDDFAAYVGTVKETLVRVLKDLKEQEIVETQGRKIRILNHAALEEIADFF
jgi:CRP-like cAMP-binding protein